MVSTAFLPFLGGKSRKSTLTPSSSTSFPTNPPTFPFRSLPYELQLLIAKQSLLSPLPIVIGTKITTWKPTPESDLHARRANAILQTCHDFSRGELYRYYYENNTFELGYYYEARNFFTSPGRDLVRYVVVDMLRVLVRPAGGANTIIQKLRLLPNLRVVSMRIRGGINSSSLLDERRLGDVFVGMCRALPGLEGVELRVECSADEDEGVLERVKGGYERFFEERVGVEQIWPGEVPGWWRDVKFTVAWEESPAAPVDRRTSTTSLTPGSRTAKLKNWVDGRLASQTRLWV